MRIPARIEKQDVRRERVTRKSMFDLLNVCGEKFAVTIKA